MKDIKIEDTRTVKTELVLPNDTNTLGNLMGGKLLHWMDICAAISAHRLSKRVVVTSSVTNVSFSQPIKLGEVVTLESEVSRSFNSSMEVFITVFIEDLATGKKKECNSAFFNFVAVDQLGKPIEVPKVITDTKEQQERYIGALRRRQLSLILAKKMKPEEASELKALFS